MEKYLGLIAAVLLLFAVDSKSAEYPGKKSGWRGFDQYKFEHNKRKCIIVCPKETAEGKPWVWRARFFGTAPEFDIMMLKKGYHIAYIDVGGLLGAPKAVKIWDDFYKYLCEKHNFSKKPILEGLSRGGLIIYNWGAANPDKVLCIYGDAPVCDFKSWPGAKAKWLWEPYGFTSEEEALKYDKNPIDNLEPLAKAKVPLISVVGDTDRTVPVAENTAIMEKRYKALGGTIKVIHKPGVGHHPHGLKDPTPIVDFILKQKSQ
jgi:pimeloyl-ACP methyl ester carboxylesterase